jgi:uncharacterized protein (TIGR02246 family)
MEYSSKLAPEDEAAIRALLDRMGQAWARGDGEAYASVFSEDATYDNAPGQRVVGRQEIAASHQRIFDSVLRHTRLGSGYPVRLQPVTPEVVLVHASGAVLFAGEDEAKVPPNGLLTMVAARRGDRWQFVSFSNVPTGKGRNVRFLWRFLVSRLAAFRAEVVKARRYMLEEKQRNMSQRTRDHHKTPSPK